MKKTLMALGVFLLFCMVSWTYAADPSNRGDPIHGLSPETLWVANNYDEIMDLCFGIEPSRSTWEETPPVAWRLVARVDDFRSAVLYRVTALKGEVLVQRRTARAPSLWDAALAAHSSDPAASPADVATRIAVETATYSSRSCSAITALSDELLSVPLGSIRDFRVATHFYRFRVDIAKPHWIEGEMVGSPNDEPEFNPPLVNWIVRLGLELTKCEQSATNGATVSADAPRD